MVPGEGPQPALGMIVGEAPNHDDEERGRPLSGPYGRILDSALRTLGVRREQFYVTNAVKEMTLDSEGRIRKPTDEEILAWLPILESEIEYTSPAVILALGRTAQRALVPGAPAESIPYGSIIGNVYVAWHPALIAKTMRGTRARAVIFADWLKQLEPWVRARRLYAA